MLLKKSIFPWSLKIFVLVIINLCVNRIKVELNQRNFKYGEILEIWDLLRNSKRVISCMFVENGFTGNAQTIS